VTRPARLPSARAALPALLLALVPLAACSGDSDAPTEDPEVVLAEAQEVLASTSGLRLSLTTDDLPQGVTGVTRAEGVATAAPAFDGVIEVPFAGSEVEVPVISVDGTVYAQIPLTVGWSEVDPAEYGAPDPAALVDPRTGFPGLLTSTYGVQVGDSVRGGEGNREVLTEYSGTVPGEAVAGIIPTAVGEFDVTYTITDDAEVREVVMTGAFYPDADRMTYTVGLDDYGLEQEITAP